MHHHHLSGKLCKGFQGSGQGEAVVADFVAGLWVEEIHNKDDALNNLYHDTLREH